MRENSELPKRSDQTPFLTAWLTLLKENIDKEGTVGLHVQHLLNYYCLLFMGQRHEHSVNHLLL